MTDTAHERVLIVDFGSQVTQLIARRLRESGVYCEIHPYDKVEGMLEAFGPKAVILSGGPASVHEDESPSVTHRVFELGVPVLGICYGEMTMVSELGGKVEGGHSREFGRAEILIERESPLLAGLGEIGAKETVWMSHGDKITAIPQGFHVVASSEGSPYAVIADEGRRFYGIQFHPEVAHTPRGALMLRNFTHKIAGLDHGFVPPGDGGEDPRSGWLREGDLRPVRRRRFLGGGGADPRGHRGPADLRLRRHRPLAPERGRAGRDHVPRPLQHPARAC
jgi:GMP synthase (glutamine-hydrolysing)